ncbi:MAG: glycosyltransferase, partial [Gammaproteobacteria bacterium]|nr:glycosyltransferase [Gammaproteobacteria bacterium]
MKKISIIVPAHNEEQTIVPLLQAVRRAIDELSIPLFEVIVIDDGSNDTTRALLL